MSDIELQLFSSIKCINQERGKRQLLKVLNAAGYDLNGGEGLQTQKEMRGKLVRESERQSAEKHFGSVHRSTDIDKLRSNYKDPDAFVAQSQQTLQAQLLLQSAMKAQVIADDSSSNFSDTQEDIVVRMKNSISHEGMQEMMADLPNGFGSIFEPSPVNYIGVEQTLGSFVRNQSI